MRHLHLVAEKADCLVNSLETTKSESENKKQNVQKYPCCKRNRVGEKSFLTACQQDLHQSQGSAEEAGYLVNSLETTKLESPNQKAENTLKNIDVLIILSIKSNHKV